MDSQPDPRNPQLATIMNHAFRETLTALGTPDELWHQARALSAWPAPQPHNAHVHLPPNFSAFTTVAQAVELAAQQKLIGLGTANYYDYTVYDAFASLAPQAGVFPVLGLEILSMDESLRQAGIKVNDPGNPGKVYLCGKAIQPSASLFSPQAQQTIERIRRDDAARLSAMIDQLETYLTQQGVPTGLNYARIVDRVVARHGCPAETVFLQERHVAQAFQEVLFEKLPAPVRLERLNTLLRAATKAKSPEDAVTVQNDLRSHLLKAGKVAFVPEPFIPLEAARDLVLQLGGIPAYPVLADGASPICPFEEPVDGCIVALQQRRLHAVELIPVRNSPEVLLRYARAFRRAGLVVTAGTEHNTLDLLAMAPTCMNGVAIPREAEAIFWEGFLVLVAHQTLISVGARGFVTPEGHPCDGFTSADQRIQAFAKLGAVVLERFTKRK